MLHINLVTPDLKKTYEFLHKEFGSEKVEMDSTKFLDSSDIRISKTSFKTLYTKIK